MSAPPLAEALTRVERLLFEAPVLESFIARREVGQSKDGDAETADALAHELVSHQAANGSWGESLALTSEALLLLADLRPFDADVTEATSRAIAWLRSRQRASGAWAQDCSPDRHEAGLCNHFATGFFSPGDTAVNFGGTQLSNGARFPSDDDARLALSAMALRVMLSFEAPQTDDVLHIDALQRLAALLFRPETRISMPAAITVVATLTQVPRNAGRMAVLHGALSRLAGMQRADGSWPGAEMFHVADTLLLTVRSGFGSPVFDAALGWTAEMLALTQQPDGSWGQDSGPYRLLIGWRTLRFVAGNRER